MPRDAGGPDGWRVVPGAPGKFVAPAARDHGSPPTALLGAPLLTPTAPVVAQVAEAVVGATVATVLLPVALTLALILASTTPANAPGLPPLDRDALRLCDLQARHMAGTLTTDEEAELIALLAKVKGIRVRSLHDLADANAAALPLKGLHVPLRNFTYLHNFPYTKRPTVDKDLLRRKFDSSGRAAFLRNLADDPAKMTRLEHLGMSNQNLERIRRGEVPVGYQVHHKLSLNDGGDNSFANLVLIKDDPYHRAITAYQNSATRGLQPGETKVLNWVAVNDYVYPNY